MNPVPLIIFSTESLVKCTELCGLRVLELCPVGKVGFLTRIPHDGYNDKPKSARDAVNYPSLVTIQNT